MFGWLRRRPAPLVAERKFEPIVTRPREVVVKRYAAAGIKPTFGGWNANIRSGNAELAGALSTLRGRCRALERDNPHVMRYLQLRADNVIGSAGFGFSSQVKQANGAPDSTVNDRIEAGWKEWCKRPTVCGRFTFADVMRLTDRSRSRDGDVFIEHVIDKKYKDSYAIAVHEGDMLDETYTTIAKNGNKVRMGVELDSVNKPVAYWFRTSHPGDNDFTVPGKMYRRVPAENIIHLHKTPRPGQVRGAPDFTSVMTYLHMLDGYRESEVTNRRARACVGGFFERDAPESTTLELADTEIDGELEMDFEPGQARALPAGWKFNAFDPSNNGGDYSEFEKQLLRACASGLAVSYCVLANDMEGVSFSSLRQDILNDREMWKTEQQFMIDHAALPIFARWVGMHVGFFSDVPISKLDRILKGATFAGRRWAWVDPLKDVKAAKEEIAASLTSYSRIARENGVDYGDIVAELAEDKALREAKGIELETEVKAAQGKAASAQSGGDGAAA